MNRARGDSFFPVGCLVPCPPMAIPKNPAQRRRDFFVVLFAANLFFYGTKQPDDVIPMPDDPNQSVPDPVQRGVEGIGKVLRRIFRF